MKKYFFVLSGGLLLGILATLIYTNWYLSDYFISQEELEQNLKAVISQQTVSPTPAADRWQKIVADNAPSMVAVETFSANRIIAKGNGIVVSADGLIMTTADVARSAQVYQLTLNDKVMRGKVVYRNVAKNISFLKVEETDLSPVAFVQNYAYASGMDVILTGKTIELSKSAPFAQRASINYVTDKTIVLDAYSDVMLAGAAVITDKNELLGMAYMRNTKVHMVSADVIREAMNEFLSQGNQ